MLDSHNTEIIVALLWAASLLLIGLLRSRPIVRNYPNARYCFNGTMINGNYGEVIFSEETQKMQFYVGNKMKDTSGVLWRISGIESSNGVIIIHLHEVTI